MFKVWLLISTLNWLIISSMRWFLISIKILHLLRVRKISVSIVSHSGLKTLHLYLLACLDY